MIHPLRITVVGSLCGGSATVAECAARALLRLGHRVTFVNNRRFEPEMTAIRLSPSSDQTREDRMWELFIHAAAVTRYDVIASRPQIAIYLAQAPIVSKEDIAALRLRDITTIFWFVEHHTLFPYWRTAIGYFDYFWTIERGEFPAMLTSAGQPNVDYVPLACDPEIHYPRGPSETSHYSADVAFAGTGTPARRRFFLALSDIAPRLYGTGWSRDSALAPFLFHDGDFPYSELPKVFSAARVNLNVAGDRTATVTNPRAFEICACGGFQLADAAIPLEPFFEPGRDVITFLTPDEARDRIRYYLSHEIERRTIAARAMERAHSEHTYDIRLRSALERVFDRC